MKKSLICLLVLIISLSSIYFVLGETINAIFPDNVIMGKEFEVNLELIDFPKDMYDVKIDILNGTNYLAKRNWTDGWYQNRWMNNHTNTSISNNSIIKLNVSEEYEGVANLTIKIRKSGTGGSGTVYGTYQINITEQEDTSQNNTQQNNTNNQEASSSLDTDWNEDDIINGEEFDIELTAKNLGDKKYDIKVWIEDDGNVISDRYDKENDEWKSGTYYINNFFVGPGNETGEIKLKIRDDYVDFSGNVRIYFKIRDGQEISKSIKILEKDENADDEQDGIKDNTEETEISQPIKSNSSIAGNVIRLGNLNSEETGNVKDEKNTINTDLVYESENEKIKIYSVFGFALLCLGLVILIIFKKIK